MIPRRGWPGHSGVGGRLGQKPDGSEFKVNGRMGNHNHRGQELHYKGEQRSREAAGGGWGAIAGSPGRSLQNKHTEAMS